MPTGVYPRTEYHKKRMSEGSKGQIPWNKGIPQTPEQRKKSSESKKGRSAWNKGQQIKEKSHFWLGGTKIKYAPGISEGIKEQVRERDNRSCCNCNKKENELNRKLETHHIDFGGDNHNLENLISLCRRCHLLIHKQYATATAV